MSSHSTIRYLTKELNLRVIQNRCWQFTVSLTRRDKRPLSLLHAWSKCSFLNQYNFHIVYASSWALCFFISASAEISMHTFVLWAFGSDLDCCWQSISAGHPWNVDPSGTTSPPTYSKRLTCQHCMSCGPFTLRLINSFHNAQPVACLHTWRLQESIKGSSSHYLFMCWLRW